MFLLVRKIKKKLLTMQISSDIIVAYFKNALMELFLIKPFIKESRRWCECGMKVIGKPHSGAEQLKTLSKRLRLAPLPWQKA